VSRNLKLTVSYIAIGIALIAFYNLVTKPKPEPCERQARLWPLPLEFCVTTVRKLL